jgi:hypothetical protein
MLFECNINYEELMTEAEFNRDVIRRLQATESDFTIQQARSARFNVFTFEKLISIAVSEVSKTRGQELAEAIADWHLESTENVLKALLANGFDLIAM